MSVKIWADEGDRIGVGFCLHCEHAYGGHYDSCKFHVSNLNRLFWHADKAFVFYTNHDGRNLKYVFGYEGNLTQNKMLEMGGIAFRAFMIALDHEDRIKAWDDADDDERMRWVKTRAGRYVHVEVEQDYTYELFTVNHDRGSMGTSIHDGFQTRLTLGRRA